MASKLPASLLRRSLGRPSLRPTTTMIIATAPCLRLARAPAAAAAASYSTEAPAPPLLAKLKDDLKTAMRAKDANRLAVLRAVLAATLNASKTDKPIQTDAQLVGLLHKTARKSQEAAAEARAANRADLAEKEESQQRILEEYAAGSGVRELGGAELRQLVESTKAGFVEQGLEGKALMGQMVKTLLAPGGPLEGASFDKKEVVSLITEVTKA